MREYDLTEPHIKPLKNLDANFGLKVYQQNVYQLFITLILY